jgi:GMP synthase-like glutamine amidotransferase
MKKPIVIIRHVDYERLGWIPSLLDELEIPYLSISLSKGDDFPALTEISGVISMGGPMSAYQLKDFPFLEEEMIYQKKLIENDLPVLGICLGAQIMCQAFGAEVKKGTKVELGWLPLQRLPEADSDPVFTDLNVPELFQLHYDVFDLPEEAVRLLKSETCENQAFRLSDGVYGLQFHPETDPNMISSVLEEYRPKLNESQLEQVELDPIEKSSQGRVFLKKLLKRIFIS